MFVFCLFDRYVVVHPANTYTIIPKMTRKNEIEGFPALLLLSLTPRQLFAAHHPLVTTASSLAGWWKEFFSPSHTWAALGAIAIVLVGFSTRRDDTQQVSWCDFENIFQGRRKGIVVLFERVGKTQKNRNDCIPTCFGLTTRFVKNGIGTNGNDLDGLIVTNAFLQQDFIVETCGVAVGQILFCLS